MTTIIIKFDLPEDRIEMQEYIKGPTYGIALDDITGYLRHLYKYDYERVEKMLPMELLEEIRDHISTLIPPETT